MKLLGVKDCFGFVTCWSVKFVSDATATVDCRDFISCSKLDWLQLTSVGASCDSV